MADKIIYVRDAKSGDLMPIKLIDNGDGTYQDGPIALFLESIAEVQNG